MKLTISPLKAIVSLPTYSIGYDNFNVLLKVHGDIIYNDIPQNNTSVDDICYDGKEQAIQYSINSGGLANYQLICDFDFHNVYDYLDLDITISKTGYKSYNKVVRIYGLDVGIPIIMVENSYIDSLIVFSKFTILRPLCDYQYIYRGTNANYNKIEHFDDAGNLVSTLSDFVLNINTTKKVRTTITSNGVTSTESAFTTYNKINWIPELGVSFECLSPAIMCDDCFTKLTDNKIILYLNNNNITSHTVDGVIENYSIFPHFGATFNLIDTSNDIVITNSKGFNKENLINYHKESNEFVVNEIGDFRAVAELEIVGDFITVQKQNIPVGYYLVLNESGDISSTNPLGTFANLEIIETQTIGSVASDNGLQLVPVFNHNNISDVGVGYYKVLDDDNLFLNGNPVTSSIIYINDGDNVTITTGTNGMIAPVNAIYGCMTSVPVKGCNPYDIRKTGCNTFDLINKSLASEVFNIYKLENDHDDNWVLKAEDLTVDSGDSYPITFSRDGIYKIEIADQNLIIMNSCSLEKCKLMFLQKLMCCPDDSLCDDRDHVRFNSKEFYNYNAFLLIVHNLGQIVNLKYGYFQVLDVITDADLERYFEIHSLLNRAMDYCGECETC